MYAAPATSASVMPLSGEPRTWKRLSLSSMSSGAASKRCATIRVALSATFLAERAAPRRFGGAFVGGARRALAADGERARAVRAHPVRAGAGVAVDDLDLRR